MLDTNALNDTIKTLVDAWCERRELSPLRILLPAWPMPLGLTDDWNDLRDALRHVRAMARESVTEAERVQLNLAIAFIDQTLSNR
jgi:hypothetical protein